MVAKNPTKKMVTSRRNYDRKVRKKDTFGVQQNQQKENKGNGKKAAIILAAALLSAATISIPAVIYYQKNLGYMVKIEQMVDGKLVESSTKKLKKGSKIGDIIPPDIPGKFFMGYYKNENFNDSSNMLDPNSKIGDDTTVYLYYVPISYYLDFSGININYIDNITFTQGDKTVNDKTELHYQDEFCATILDTSGYLDTLYIDGAVEITETKIEAGEKVPANQHYFKVNAGNSEQRDKYLTVHYERQSLRFNVTFFDYDGSSYEFKDLTYNTPIPSPTYKDKLDNQQFDYTFKGWAEADRYGNPTNLDEEGNPVVIPQQDFVDGAVFVQNKNMYFVAVFEEKLQKYQLTIEANPPAVAQCVEIYINNVKVTDENNGQVALYQVEYDSTVKISYKQREGWHKKSFTIGGVEQNADSVEFSMKNDITVRYEEELNSYMLGEIPEDVNISVVREGKVVPLHSNDTIYHFEELTFTYTLDDKYELKTFTVNNQKMDNGGKFTVNGPINITFIKDVKIFSVGIIPRQVEVLYNGQKVTNNQRLEYGSVLTISYKESDGYKMTKFLVNDQEFESGNTLELKSDLKIDYDEELKTYKMGKIPENVTVTRQDKSEVNEGDIITHFEKLTVAYTLKDGHHMTEFSVNGQTPTNDQTSLTIEVAGEVDIIFEQAINVYTVVFMDENKSTELDRVTGVEWGTSASTNVVPTKDSDSTFNYTFNTWVDENGEQQDLSSIKQDMVVYASYTAEYVEYGISISDPEHVTVTFLNGNSVHKNTNLTNQDKLYYGDSVRVSYTSSEGYTRTVFSINDSPIAKELVTTDVVIHGDLKVDYEEEINVYQMSEIPAGVTVSRESGDEVHPGDQITHFEKLTLHYELPEHHSLIEFKVNGKSIPNDYKHTVEGPFTIVYIESINKYALGEIPAGVTVTKDGQPIESGAQLEYGTEIVISYKLETGKHLTKFAVNNKDVQQNDYHHIVKDKVTIVFTQEYDTFKMTTIPQNVTVLRQDGQPVNTGDTITYNEVLTVSYKASEGHHRTKFVVAGNSIDKELTSTTVTVTDAFTIEYKEDIDQFVVHFYDEYNEGQAKHLADVTVNWNTAASTTTPKKKSSNTYSYTFDYWVDKNGDRVDLSNVKEDKTVYAHYDEQYIEYKLNLSGSQIIVKYKDGSSKYDTDQTLTSENTLHYGDTITISYKASEGHEKTSFKINDAEQQETEVTHIVHGDVKVEYTEVAIQYDVTFYDYLGNKLPEEIKVAYGQKAVYPGDTPTKPSTEEYYYTFIGWGTEQEGDEVSDLTITKETKLYAKFSQKWIEYSINIPTDNISVTFVSGNSQNAGQLNNQSKLYYGDIIKIVRTPSYGKQESSFETTGLQDLGEGNYKVINNINIIYTESYIENKIQINLPDHVTIEYVDGTSEYSLNQRLSTNNTLHCGDTVRITFTASKGFSGKLSVTGATTQSDNLYTVTGELNLVYEEDYIDYNITIPVGVTVMRNGESVQNGATVHINDQLTVSYELKPGYHVTEFAINDSNINQQSTTYTVQAENVEIKFKSEINTYTVNFPSQVTVRRDGSKLQSGDTVEYGQLLTITYEETPGKRKTLFECSAGLTLKKGTQNDYEISSLENNQALYVYYEEDYIPYTLVIPEGVKVVYKSGSSSYEIGQTLTNKNTLHYDDVITVSYELGEDMMLNYFTINQQSYTENNQQHTVKGNVEITFDSIHAYLTFNEIEGGWEVSSLKNSNQTEIVIPATYKNKPVLQIANNCFSNKARITSVTIKNGVKTIGQQAFANCSLLETLSLPASVTEIGDSAFANCALSNITLTGVTKLGNSAFEGNQNLSQLNLGNNLQTIGESAFKNCQQLLAITIPASVQTIGTSAFENCNLTTVVIDSASVYNSVSNVSGEGLITNATTIKVLQSVVDGNNTNEYLNNKTNFRKTQQDNYYVYTLASTLEFDLTITGEENLSVVYLGGNSDYRVNDELQSGSKIHYGDQLKITYSLDIGHHKEVFTVNGNDFTSGDTHVVEDDVTIIFTQQIDQHVLTISGNGEVTVTKGDQQLRSGDTVNYGDELVIEYTKSKGKTGQFTYSGLTLVKDSTYKVTATQNNQGVEVSYNESWIDYHITIPNHVSVKYLSGSSGHTENSSLINNDIIHYDDKLLVTCTPTKGYKVTLFKIDGEDKDSGAEHNISVGEGDVVIEYSEEQNLFTVNFFNEDGTPLGTVDVEYNKQATWSGTVPSKKEDDTYTYEFSGSWSTKQGDSTPADLTITESANFYAIMRAQYKEYTISIPDGVTVNYVRGTSGNTIGEDTTHKAHTSHNDTLTALTSNSKLHFDDVITISYAQTEGWHKNVFTVNGTDFTSGQEFTVAGNTEIIFTQEVDQYTISSIPDNVTITFVSAGANTTSDYQKDANITADSVLHYGDKIKFTYAHTGYTFNSFTINQDTQAQNPYTHTVTGNITNISVDESVNTYTLTFPQNVRVYKGSSNSGTPVTSAEQNNVSYTDTLYVEFTIPDGHKNGTITPTGLQIESGTPTTSGSTYTITATENGAEIQLKYADEWIDYSLTIPDGVTVTYVDGTSEHEMGYTLSSSDKLHYGDTISITTTLQGYENEPETIVGVNVDGASLSDTNYTVEDNVNITLSISHKYLQFTLVDDTYRVDGFAEGKSSETVIIPNTFMGTNVTAIKESAFSSKSNITELTIGEHVTSIGKFAFRDCTALTTINYNAANVGDLTASSYVFNGAGTSGNGITVTFGEKVTRIPFYLFDGCDGITSVSIGLNVTGIGSYAFRNCSNLSIVDMQNATSLNEIGAYTFRGCSINEITIPENVTSLGGNTFYNCTELTTINYNAAKVHDFPSRSYLFEKAGTSGKGITVTFGDQVTKIPAYLFADAENITSVTIGENVTSIGKQAFFLCTELTTINYNAANVEDLTASSEVFYKAGATGEGITVTFGDQVTRIPAYLFYSSSDSPKITSVTIGENVTSIGNWAFRNCNTLAVVTVNSSEIYNQLTTESACGYLINYATTINVPKTIVGDGLSNKFLNGTAYKRTESGTNYVYTDVTTLTFSLGTIPDGVTIKYVSGKSSYTKGETLSNNAVVHYGDALEIIGGFANEPDTVVSLKVTGATEKNGNYLVDDEITIEVTAEHAYLEFEQIESGYKVVGLNAENVPVTKSGEVDVFNITIPDTFTGVPVVEIDWANIAYPSSDSQVIAALKNATTSYQLRITLKIGNNVEKIGDYAFFSTNNYLITSLDLDVENSKLTTIGSYAFGNVGFLDKNIDCYDFVAPKMLTTLNANAFTGAVGRVFDFSHAENMTTIGQYAFASTTSLYYDGGSCFIPPANLTKIEYAAFTGSAMFNIDLRSAKSLTTIESYAFATNDERFKTIALPESLTTIGANAFNGVTSLSTVIFDSKDIYDLCRKSVSDGSTATVAGGLLSYFASNPSNCTIRVKKSIIDGGDSDTWLTGGFYLTKSSGEGEWSDYYIYS